MRTIVSVQEIDELEIRPRSEVAEWRRLVASEIENSWKDRSSWVIVSCPCCAVTAARPAFERCDIAYVECTSCGSVYAPRRPDEATLRSWYRDSTAARFWRERMLTASRDIRYEKIAVPRARWVMDGIAEYAPRATRLLDVSSNGRAMVDVIVAERPELQACMAAPAADLEGESQGRVAVRPTPVDELAGLGPMDLMTAIDVFDRVSDLPGLVRAARDTLALGGVLFATCPVASGFEIQALWDRSPSVLPPDRLNLPTVDGLLHMFSGQGWEMLELSTPGMFDVAIVRRAIADSPEVAWPRALRALVEDADREDGRPLTEYLQSRRLASFARLVVRRVY
jgi:hypothetical protein